MRLDAESDRISRQLVILDWLFGRYAACLPPERVVAYEEVIASGGAALAAAFSLELPVRPLGERNASRLYPMHVCEELAMRLQKDRGAWRSRYGEQDVAALLERMRDGAAA